MKKMKYFAFVAAVLLAGMAGFTACSSDNEEVLSPNVVFDEMGNKGVKPEFAISIPRSVVSRMSNEVTQKAGNSAVFRGMEQIQLVPFNAAITKDLAKSSDVINLENITALQKVGSLNYKVYADKFVPVGTSNFLFYGKAIDKPETPADKFKYGVLTAANLGKDFTTPAAVQFGLERINADKNAIAGDATGQAIINLLNDIASVEGWATTENDNLKNLYTKFTSLTVAASYQVAIVLSDLYYAAAHVDMEDAAYDLSKKIRKAIEVAGTPKSNQAMELKAEYKGFPANLNLPDGAARIAWNGTKFEDATATYGENKADLTQYAYPAALWYYANTPIKASDDIESTEYATQASWNNVIGTVYGAAGDKVTDNTQSVALVNPAQYAVGRLEVTVKLGEEGKTDFFDHDGKKMDVSKGFTLKGILIGGQCGVGYDFTTLGNENLTIYDCDVAAGTLVSTEKVSTENQTLALETKADLPVNIALELVNNGPEFVGRDGGIIPAGATFYLAAKLDPAQANNYKAGELDKVFMQDHVTKVTVTIKNGTEGTPDDDGPGGGGPTIPDLSSPNIELGTSVDLEWQEGLIFEPAI